MFSRLSVLTHFNLKWQLYIDLNVFKKFEFEVHVYYMKITIKNTEASKQKNMKSIFFLSWLLTDIKIQYWSTELKIVSII